MLYRNGDEDDAEAVLVSVVRADDSMQEQVNAMIARGRGEPVDERGYVLRKGKFESLRQIELQKISRRLLGKLDVAMRSKDAEARGVFVRETLAGEGSLDAGQSLSNLAAAHHALGEYAEADGFYKRARTVLP